MMVRLNDLVEAMTVCTCLDSSTWFGLSCLRVSVSPCLRVWCVWPQGGAASVPQPAPPASAAPAAKPKIYTMWGDRGDRRFDKLREAWAESWNMQGWDATEIPGGPFMRKAVAADPEVRRINDAMMKLARNSSQPYSVVRRLLQEFEVC